MTTLLILASLLPMSGIQSTRYPPIQYHQLRIQQYDRGRNQQPSTGILRPFRLKRANIIQRKKVYLYDTSLRHLYRKPPATIHTFPSGHTITITPDN